MADVRRQIDRLKHFYFHFPVICILQTLRQNTYLWFNFNHLRHISRMMQYPKLISALPGISAYFESFPIFPHRGVPSFNSIITVLSQYLENSTRIDTWKLSGSIQSRKNVVCIQALVSSLFCSEFVCDMVRPSLRSLNVRTKPMVGQDLYLLY